MYGPMILNIHSYIYHHHHKFILPSPVMGYLYTVKLYSYD